MIGFIAQRVSNNYLLKLLENKVIHSLTIIALNRLTAKTHRAINQRFVSLYILRNYWYCKQLDVCLQLSGNQQSKHHARS